MESLVINASNVFNQAGRGFEPSLEKRVFAATGGQFNVLELFRKIFGYRGIPYGVVPIQKEIASAQGPDALETLANAKIAEITSALGTPIFQPLKIDGWLFPNEPLVTVTGQKKIVETTSAGGTNDVIEHISLGHYQVKIQGLLVNMESDDAPEAEISKIVSLYEANQSLEIQSPMLSLFDIKLFAFKSISFPALEGSASVQGYEITGRSDKYIELEFV